AEAAADVALGRDEVGGARGVQDVLVGRVLALGAVAVDQRFGRLARQHQLQLPRQVFGILHAAIGAARAEGRDAVGGVAGEHDAAVAELVHALAGKGVDADPFQLELRVGPEQRADARQHVLGRCARRCRAAGAAARIGSDVVGLAVQQHGLVGVEGRVEPEPALGREVGLHLDVGDEEAVAEDAAVAFLADQLAHRRTGAVAGDQPVRVQRIRAVGRLHAQRHAVVRLRHGDDLVLPAQIDIGFLARLLVQIAFGVVLLQVDEGRAAMAGFRQQVEAPHFLFAEEDLAHVPRHALVDHALADAEAVPDFQRALGKTDGA
uniref:Phenol hydroxylase n=1 Tax=Parastrongyloides trichosuri TaxID=131310 RepID=A0A0N4Z6B8_PARTI